MEVTAMFLSRSVNDDGNHVHFPSSRRVPYAQASKPRSRLSIPLTHWSPRAAHMLSQTSWSLSLGASNVQCCCPMQCHPSGDAWNENCSIQLTANRGPRGMNASSTALAAKSLPSPSYVFLFPPAPAPAQASNPRCYVNRDWTAKLLGPRRHCT